MNRIVDPESIAPPAAAYAHGIVSTAPGRILHTAGVVAVRPDGTVPHGIAEQAETVWSNLTAILAEADMMTTDIVSVVTYAVVGEDLGPVMAARDAALEGHIAASTLVTVPALVRPEWRVEVAIVAVAD